MGQSERENTLPPFTAFRFEVVLTLDNPPEGVVNPVCDAAFSECTGLDMSMEPKPIANSGNNLRQTYRIAPVTYGRLTLRRGMTENLHIWHWFQAAAVPGANRTASGQITMMNADGQPTVIFTLDECLPVRVAGPSLNAQTGQVALEELQLVYQRLQIKLPGQPDTGLNLSAGFSVGVGLGGGVGVNASASAQLRVGGGPGLGGSINGSASANFGIK